ncbi:N-acetyltransferase [Haloferax mediterranei ATCC 33500]|uniref:Acetyltransferase n=1 Tax=Haloferax mediterranei (strain ATCC 33500 / DSM 1411 / JCM 8866 / NBRC 14739 / NCIMB 2177 / R-4) TaxID=523841 RepID=I3R7G5_HALMT|nr:GNAT family protein [Haloferax mediterranei]AFK20175.1 acetyltransferase [Haloferax mediterranei ATCC 33500]AHZ23549.1 acetyltransferase [Haloferax mediterranei ATCC 33500]ELZ99724.1 acetyltransferase [Haloferax mediterranei ATCC 33500]MDX5987072.1 GNAT family protein [Haloferax mediterranei ATCC 33500]QCQ76387.1 N-acetyltransferase [Haloferax mediterranei ATCC 33500]
MPGAIFLEGDRVELRTIESEDTEFLHETINDRRVRQGLAAVDPVTRSNERDWVESRGEGDDINFLICDGGEPVGTIGLKPPNVINGATEVGYMVAPDHWGNDYATDALRALCGYAFEERRLNKVYANAYETNPASSRVLEKVGFQREGVHREQGFVDGEHVDVFRYGLLAHEWQHTADEPGRKAERDSWI